MLFKTVSIFPEIRSTQSQSQSLVLVFFHLLWHKICVSPCDGHFHAGHVAIGVRLTADCDRFRLELEGTEGNQEGREDYDPRKKLQEIYRKICLLVTFFEFFLLKGLRSRSSLFQNPKLTPNMNFRLMTNPALMK